MNPYIRFPALMPARMPPRLLPGLLACFVLAFPVIAAEPARTYSNYVDDGRTKFDTNPGDTGPLAEGQLLPALLSALDQLSRYARPVSVPEIYRVPHEELQRMVCGAPCAALATYRSGEGIYLDDKLKPETNLFDRSVLLHELVHYLQDMNNEHGDMKPCERWYHREQEAYAIQKRFLITVGSPVRVGYSAHKSTCDDDIAR